MSLKFSRKGHVSTGSTLLNLALLNNPYGGLMLGKCHHLVGDSDTGKTFFGVATCAESTINPELDGYDIIYDNVENGMNMDLDVLFGERLADRIRPPYQHPRTKTPVHSSTVEDFYYHVDAAINRAGWDTATGQPIAIPSPRPFIYVLDSSDGLDDVKSDAKFAVGRKAHEKRMGNDDGEAAEKVAGSYGMDKAKLHSQNLRRVQKWLRRTNSILIIISQTRDNPDPMSFERRVVAGGKALKFYSQTQSWTSLRKTLTRHVKGKDRKVGIRAKIEVKKNHQTGRKCDVEVDIYNRTGIDDVGSCVDYLVEEGHWSKSGNTINASDLGSSGLSGMREKLIKQIEEGNHEDAMREIVGRVWAEIDHATTMPRKNRYAASK